MQAHANDLRAEVKDGWASLVGERTAAAPAAPDDRQLDDFVHKIVDNWRTAGLKPAMMALLAVSEKITRAPGDMEKRDIEALRETGWSDEAIHDAVQVVAYFNYINRIADALGVEPEEHIPHWGRSLG